MTASFDGYGSFDCSLPVSIRNTFFGPSLQPMAETQADIDLRDFLTAKDVWMARNCPQTGGLELIEFARSLYDPVFQEKMRLEVTIIMLTARRAKLDEPSGGQGEARSPEAPSTVAPPTQNEAV